MNNPLYREGNGGIPIPAGLGEEARHADAEPSAARELLAQWMLQSSYATGHGDTVEDLIAELQWQHAERLSKRRNPVAWRVKDFADGWIYYGEEAHARRAADEMGGAFEESLYAQG